MQLTKVILRDEKILIRTPDFNQDFVKSMQSIPKGHKTWNPTHEYWTVYKPYTQQALDALKKFHRYYTVVDKRGQPDPTFDVKKFNLDMKKKAKAEEDRKAKVVAAQRAAQRKAQQQQTSGYQYHQRHNPHQSQWGSQGTSASDWRRKQANKASSTYRKSDAKRKAEEKAEKKIKAKKKANRLVERRSGINFGQACDILGVEKTATYAEMKKAYRALAKKHHPRTQEEHEDEERKVIVANLNNAWDVIKAYKVGA